MFANSKPNRFTVFGKRRGINDQIHGWLRFIAAPEAHLIEDQIDARAAIGDFVGANDFLQLYTNPRAGVRHRQTNDGGVLLQTAPVAFKSKSFAAHDAQRGEESPAVDQASLSGRQAYLFNWEELVVVVDVAVNQREPRWDWVHQYCIGQWRRRVEVVSRE